MNVIAYTKAFDGYNTSSYQCYALVIEAEYYSASGGSATVHACAYLYNSWTNKPFENYPTIYRFGSINGTTVYNETSTWPGAGTWESNTSFEFYSGRYSKWRQKLWDKTLTVNYGYGATKAVNIKAEFESSIKNQWPPSSKMSVTGQITLPYQEKPKPPSGNASVTTVNRDSIYCYSNSTAGSGSITYRCWTVTPQTATFTITDVVKVNQFVTGTESPTAAQIAKYDINRNGYIDNDDLEFVRHDVAGWKEEIASGWLYNLLPNNTYDVKYEVENSYGYGSTSFMTITTEGSAPEIQNFTLTSGRTWITFHPTIWYDYNDGLSYYELGYQPVDESDSWRYVYSTEPTINDLDPNTSYYVSICVYSQQGRSSYTWSTSERTTCNGPQNLSITTTYVSQNQISLRLSGTGDTNAPIYYYELYYKAEGASSYTYLDLSSSNTCTVNNLTPDTNYLFYFLATNDGGTTDSRSNLGIGKDFVHSTMFGDTVITKMDILEVTPFTCITDVAGYSIPEREVFYSFSLDNEQTWTQEFNSGLYTWTGLEPETEYTLITRMRAQHTSQNASDGYHYVYLHVITPSDQASARIKDVNHEWRKGKMWFKMDNAWHKVKKVYVKQGGTWKINSNK